MLLNLLIGVIGIFLSGIDIRLFVEKRQTKYLVYSIFSFFAGLYYIIAAIGMIPC